MEFYSETYPGLIFVFGLLLQSARGVDIHVAFLAPSYSPYGYNASSSFPALAYALDKVEEYHILSSGYNLIVNWYDSECDSITAAGKAVELYINNAIDVFIGPPCPDAAKVITALATYWNIPVVNWVPLPYELTNKDKYNTMLGSFGDIYASFGPVVLHLFETVDWKVCTTVHISSAYEESIQASIAKYFSRNNVEISTAFEARKGASKSEIQDIFKAIKDEARIVILIVPAEEIRKYMLVAYDLNMVDGDYVFVWVEDFASEDFLFDKKPWKGGSRNKEAKKAYQALIYITTANDVAHDEDLYKSWKSEAFSIANTPPYKDIIEDSTEADLYSPLLVYGILMYAYALNETISDGKGYTKGTHTFKASADKVLNSPMAEYQIGSNNVFISSADSNRVPGVWILNQRGNGHFKTIAFSTPYRDGSEVKFNETKLLPIRWANGKKGLENAPKDVPKCGFDGSKCRVTLNYLAIFLPICIFLVALGVGILTIVSFQRRKKVKREIAMLLWEVKYKDININSKTMGSHAKLPSKETIICDENEMCGSNSTIGDDSTESYEEQYQQSCNTKIGVYKAQVIAAKFLRKEDILVSDTLTDELGSIRKIAHNNLNVFVGACIERFCICVLWRYCSKGSLQNVISDENIKLDSYFKVSILADIISGMEYLHGSAIGSHGRLKSTNVVIDSRWVCKITDYGVTSLFEGEGDDPDSSPDNSARALYWTAPEILRQENTVRQGSKPGDVYSFGIIAKEVLCRNSPYFEFENHKPTKIIGKVMYPETNHGMIFRPTLTNIETFEHRKTVVHLIHKSWHQQPIARPSFVQLQKELQQLHRRGKSFSIVENMLNMLERYASNLEDAVNERTKQLQAEKKRCDALLHRMLPRSVAIELKEGRYVEPEWFDEVTIYFSDVVGFMSLAKESTPIQVVTFLNALYNSFDAVIKQYDVCKVETIGDAYMIVSGLPKRNGHRHAAEIASCSLDLLNNAKSFQIPHLPNTPLHIRIGCHTGPCAAGVVGNAMPRYCLFGDTVNTASRMESHGESMKIHISEQCKQALDTFNLFICPPRGSIEIKGKGQMFTYWITGSKTEYKTPGGSQEDKTETEHDAVVEFSDDKSVAWTWQ